MNKILIYLPIILSVILISTGAILQKYFYLFENAESVGFSSHAMVVVGIFLFIIQLGIWILFALSKIFRSDI